MDTPFYSAWVTSLSKSHNVFDLLREAFFVQREGDRPLTLLIIYCLMLVTHLNVAKLVEYLPLVLSPSLSLVVYFLSKEITRDERASLFASIVSALSFQTLIGIYAGFYANWIALLLGYASLTFVVKFIRYNKKNDALIFLSFYLLLAFSHLYTWSIFTVVSVALLVFNLKSTQGYNQGIILIILLILLITALMSVKIWISALIFSR